MDVTVDQLIQMGKDAMAKSAKLGQIGMYYSGFSIEEWKCFAIRYVEHNFGKDTDTQRFRELAEQITESERDFNILFSILKALDQIPPTVKKQDIEYILSQVCMNFNKFDTSIRRRHSGRDTLRIKDEYDVQDSLLSILKLFINDIRPEDYVPSYAGSNSRVDFLLPEYDVVIETKMTNSSLKDKEIGEQLIIDISRYKQHNHCKHLICFIYDKESLISNPYGLKMDLENNSNNELKVTVFISPV